MFISKIFTDKHEYQTPFFIFKEKGLKFLVKLKFSLSVLKNVKLQISACQISLILFFFGGGGVI